MFKVAFKEYAPEEQFFWFCLGTILVICKHWVVSIQKYRHNMIFMSAHNILFQEISQ